MTNQNTNDLYKHIQGLAAQCKANINYLDDNELINSILLKNISSTELKYICAIRYWYRVLVMDDMKILKDTHPGTTETTIDTNLSFISQKGSEYAKTRGKNIDPFGINTYYADDFKVKSFNQLLLTVPEINKKPGLSKILYIGARTECEILMMGYFGFNPRNISAIDLYSYSTLITLGDMHKIPYIKDSFDGCILTNCIAYSEEPQIAIEEAIRVLKPGGSLIFTVSSQHKNASYTPKKITEGKPRTGAINIYPFQKYVEQAKVIKGVNDSNIKTISIKNKDRYIMDAAIIQKIGSLS